MASALRSIFSTVKSAVAKSPPSPVPPLPFRAAINALKTEGDPEKVSQLLNQCSKSINQRSRRRHRSMAKLARDGRADLIGRLIGDQSPQDMEATWIRLLRCEARSSPRALRMLELACDTASCCLTENSISAFLTLHLKKTKIETSSVTELLEALSRRSGVKLTAMSHNQVLSGFVDQNDVDSAIEWLENMETLWNVAPTIGSYNILLGAHLKSRNLSGFDGTVAEISGKGLKYNLATYNYMITRLVENEGCNAAKRMLDKMVSEGIRPGPGICSVLVAGFCRLRDSKSARKVFDLMPQPSQDDYSRLLRAEVEEGEFDSAVETCREMMKRRKWVPPLEAVRTLVEECPSTTWEKAKEVVEEMKRRLEGKALGESWREMEAALPVQRRLILSFSDEKDR